MGFKHFLCCHLQNTGDASITLYNIFSALKIDNLLLFYIYFFDAIYNDNVETIV